MVGLLTRPLGKKPDSQYPNDSMCLVFHLQKRACIDSVLLLETKDLALETC